MYLNKMIFVIEKCCVFFAVRAEFLNIIYHSNDFTLILSLSGRAGIAWVPFNNEMFFIPLEIKRLWLLP
jgi:hypothetical protein